MNRGTKRLAAARALILEKWTELCDRELADALDVSRVVIRRLRRRLKLTRTKDNQKIMQDKNFNKSGWTRKPRKM